MFEVDGHLIEGYVEAFPSLDELLESDRIMRACYSHADEPGTRLVAFDADPAALLSGDREEHEGVLVRPLVEHLDVGLRAWLESIASDPVFGAKARELLARVDHSLPGPDEEGELDDDSDDEQDEAIPLEECWTIALYGEDVLASTARPWVDGRALPRGFRKAYWTQQDLLAGDLAIEAVTSGSRAAAVVQARVREDQVVVPGDLGEDDPQALYGRPRAVDGITPLGDWLQSMRSVDADRADELIELLTAARATP